MWYLCENNPDNEPPPRYWLGGVANQNGRTIGRKHVDIRLRASSVSRNHARLVVQKAPFYGHPRPHRQTTTVSIIDTSAYGTFLKYPEGHIRARKYGDHHRRLDKNAPVQIFDGALLAFGAPAAWWRLVWHEMVLIPSRLTPSQCQRLSYVATLTGLDVAEDWVQNATHLVANSCDPRSMHFMRALACQIAVVTPAWVEAVFEVIANACRCVTEAPDPVGAEFVSRLPDVYHYIPTFDPLHRSPISDDVVEGIFDDQHISKRPTLFQNVVFAFASEKLRSRWLPVITDCGGKTCGRVVPNSFLFDLSDHFSDRPPPRIVRIGKVPPEEHNGDEPYFNESALTLAMLKADLGVFDEFPDYGSDDASDDADSVGGDIISCKPESELVGLSEDDAIPQSTVGAKRARGTVIEWVDRHSNDEREKDPSDDLHQPPVKRGRLIVENSEHAAEGDKSVNFSAARRLHSKALKAVKVCRPTKKRAPMSNKDFLNLAINNDDGPHGGVSHSIMEDAPNIDDGSDIGKRDGVSAALRKSEDEEIANVNEDIDSPGRIGTPVQRSAVDQENGKDAIPSGDWVFPDSIKAENEAAVVAESDEHAAHDLNQRQFFKLEEKPASQELAADDEEEGIQHGEDVRPFRGTAVAMAGRVSLNVVRCVDTFDEP